MSNSLLEIYIVHKVIFFFTICYFSLNKGTKLLSAREAVIFSFKKHGPVLENVVLVSQLGFTMAGSILFCFGIGYLLDKWLSTKGLFIAIFIVLGIIGGGVTVYRQIQKALDLKSTKKSGSRYDVGRD